MSQFPPSSSAAAPAGADAERLLGRCAEAVAESERLLHHARGAVRTRVEAGGLDAEQAAGHGLAWLATYVEALRQVQGGASRPAAWSRLAQPCTWRSAST